MTCKKEFQKRWPKGGMLLETALKKQGFCIISWLNMTDNQSITEKLSELRYIYSFQLRNERSNPIVLTPYRYAGELSDLLRTLPIKPDLGCVVGLAEGLRGIKIMGFEVIMADVEELTIVSGVDE